MSGGATFSVDGQPAGCEAPQGGRIVCSFTAPSPGGIVAFDFSVENVTAPGQATAQVTRGDEVVAELPAPIELTAPAPAVQLDLSAAWHAAPDGAGGDLVVTLTNPGTAAVADVQVGVGLDTGGVDFGQPPRECTVTGDPGRRAAQCTLQVEPGTRTLTFPMTTTGEGQTATVTVTVGGVQSTEPETIELHRQPTGG